MTQSLIPRTLNELSLLTNDPKEWLTKAESDLNQISLFIEKQQEYIIQSLNATLNFAERNYLNIELQHLVSLVDETANHSIYKNMNLSRAVDCTTTEKAAESLETIRDIFRDIHMIKYDIEYLEKYLHFQEKADEDNLALAEEIRFFQEKADEDNLALAGETSEKQPDAPDIG